MKFFFTLLFSFSLAFNVFSQTATIADNSGAGTGKFFTDGSGSWPHVFNAAILSDGVALPTRTTTVLTAIKDAPSNLEAEEKIVVIDNKAVSKIFVNWHPVLGVNKYQVQYRFNNGNFITQNVASNTFDIENSQAGTYEIRVFSFNYYCRWS